MTIFGRDLSSYQHGTDVAKLPGDFVILKCTEGDTYADADYAGWVTAGRSVGKAVVAYHFLKAEVPVRDQVVWLSGHIGDRTLPVMVDVETEGNSKPGLDLVLQFADTARAYGLNPRLVYLPHWYWELIGSPSLSALSARGIGLISSQYLGGSDYPGDDAAGWRAYGPGQPVPMLYQFTSTPVDNNAYRGTITELRNFLEGTDVNLSDTVTVSGGFAARYPLTANPTDGFVAGAAIPVSVLLEGAAIRAVNNEHLLTQILAAVKAPAPVDVVALAAALEPHLNDPANSEAIALGLVQHLGLEIVAK